MKIAVIVSFGLVSFILLSYKVQVSEAGECCKSYYDGLYRYHREKWCPVFCCRRTLTSGPSMGLHCCTDPFLRTLEYRSDFCSAWFITSSGLWVPIVIGLIILAIIIGVCICVFKCCCFIC